jgi:hypothetical protein
MQRAAVRGDRRSDGPCYQVRRPVTDDLRTKLRAEIMPASWPELLYQFARGALFVVAPEADLLDVAVAVARDDRDAVAALLSTGQLRRATDDDARHFQASAGQRFQFVIVQPWVIAQAL